MPSIGDIILAIAPFIIGLLVPLVGKFVIVFSKQSKLIELLGVDEESRRVVVYLSSLFVPKGAAIDFQGQPRSYQGITVPIEEFSASAALPKAFDFDPFENIPPILRERFESKWSFFQPVSIDVNASPMQEADIDFGTRSIIALGSHGYNHVVYYCIHHGLSTLHITQNGTAIEIAKGKHKGEIITPASPSHDIAKLEKVVDDSRANTSILIAAGLGVIGTMGAVNYLIDHWHELHHSYGDKPFALVLQFGPAGQLSFEDLMKGSVIRRLPDD